MNTLFVVVYVFQLASGAFLVATETEQGQTSTYATREDCEEAIAKRLEHPSKSIVQAAPMCQEMRK